MSLEASHKNRDVPALGRVLSPYKCDRGPRTSGDLTSRSFIDIYKRIPHKKI